jgi:acyl-[acyl carrier protein]--UDP-N-acetylglucosamine O-acyltransferase
MCSTPVPANLSGRCFRLATGYVARDGVFWNDMAVANGALSAGFVTVWDRTFVPAAVSVLQFPRMGRDAMFAWRAR